MITGTRFAAIDVGSNAVRLLLSAVFPTDDQPYFKKISLIRMPIRLGEDAFINHKISKIKARQLMDTMMGFKCLIEAYRPVDFRSCATSAMREAKNGVTICNRIQRETGVNLQIIDGRQEAQILLANQAPNGLPPRSANLFVDVGGGSTEITLFSQRKTMSLSFDIGTVRILDGLVKEKQWRQMRAWVKEQSSPYRTVTATGSGGNINKIVKLAKGKNGKSVTLKKIRKIRTLLNTYTEKERVTELGLKPDRADVIIPAMQIYVSVMKWSGTKKIRVPQIGLADGLVRMMYARYQNRNSDISYI
jgi:exopolyphosphatase/guanosine-5'-triphosphate,3'-diphosphate pyrophosphatase